MRKTIPILIGAVALTGTVIAAGQERPRRHAPEESMKLTSEQKAQMRTLGADFHKADIRRQADLRVVHLELEELLADATIDEKAVLAKASQAADLQAAAFKAHVEHKLAISKILTPEQRSKKMEFGRRGRFREHHGAWKHRRHMRAPFHGPWTEPGDDAATSEKAEPQPD